MAETLGSLCDKLTIVKLKQFHSNDVERLKSLAVQEKQLQEEIETFVISAVSGSIAPERLIFSSNKIFPKKGNEVAPPPGGIGDVFGKLAETNCRLWHEQEKVYEFEKVPPEKKDVVIKELAKLNLERTLCIDLIDKHFQTLILQKQLMSEEK